MSQYKVIIKEEAQEDLRKLLHNEPKIYKKATTSQAVLTAIPPTRRTPSTITLSVPDAICRSQTFLRSAVVAHR